MLRHCDAKHRFMPFVKWGMKVNDTLCAMIAGANGYRDEDGIWRGESRHHAAFRIRFAETRRERDGRNQLQEEDNDMERRKDEGDARGGLSREDKVGQSKRMGSGAPCERGKNRAPPIRSPCIAKRRLKGAATIRIGRRPLAAEY